MVSSSASSEVTSTAYSHTSRRASNSTKPSCSGALPAAGSPPAERSVSSTLAQAPAQQHDAALPTPAKQPNLAPLALPAGAGILPIALQHRPLQHPLDAAAPAQLEQIGLAAALGLAHHRLVPPVVVAAQQGRRTGGS